MIVALKNCLQRSFGMNSENDYRVNAERMYVMCNSDDAAARDGCCCGKNISVIQQHPSAGAALTLFLR